MAVEVQKHAYLFCVQNSTGTSMETDDESEPGSIGRKGSLRRSRYTLSSSPARSLSPPSSQRSTVTTSSVTQIVFQYNILHDLESLWWIALYFLFKRDPVGLEEDKRAKLRLAGKSVFATKETILLGQQAQLWDACKALQPITFTWGKKLDAWRQILVALYKKIEDDSSSIDVSHADHRRMQNYLSKTLHRAAEAFHTGKLMIKPWDDAGKNSASPAATPATAPVAAPPTPVQVTMGGAEINDDPSSIGKENEAPTALPIGETGQSKSVGKRSRAQQDTGPPQKRQRANNQPTCDRELRPRNRQGQVEYRVKQSRR